VDYIPKNLYALFVVKKLVPVYLKQQLANNAEIYRATKIISLDITIPMKQKKKLEVNI